MMVLVRLLRRLADWLERNYERENKISAESYLVRYRRWFQ